MFEAKWLWTEKNKAIKICVEFVCWKTFSCFPAGRWQQDICCDMVDWSWLEDGATHSAC